MLTPILLRYEFYYVMNLMYTKHNCILILLVVVILSFRFIFTRSVSEFLLSWSTATQERVFRRVCYKVEVTVSELRHDLGR